jgi:hypothetical protein
MRLSAISYRLSVIPKARANLTCVSAFYHKFMLNFSEKTCRIFWFFWVAAILCFYQTTAAQSGRKPKKDSVSIEQKTPLESNRTESEETDAPVKISSLKIVGEVQHNFDYYKSNDLDAAVKEFISFSKFISKSVPEMTKGGKMTYSEAKKQAEKETETFTLWLGFSAKDDGYGNMFIESVQYAVIQPKTAKILTRGEVKPGQNQIDMTQIPTVRRRHRAGSLSEIKNSVRQIASILVRGGWLD